LCHPKTKKQTVVQPRVNSEYSILTQSIYFEADGTLRLASALAKPHALQAIKGMKIANSMI